MHFKLGSEKIGINFFPYAYVLHHIYMANNMIIPDTVLGIFSSRSRHNIFYRKAVITMPSKANPDDELMLVAQFHPRFEDFTL